MSRSLRRQLQSGRVAVMRGPLVFCLDRARNKDLAKLDLRLLTIVPSSLEGPVADATAQAIRMVAQAIESPGGMNAVNLKVAEKYVDAFGNVAKTGNTMILPGNMAEMGSMVAAAMSIVKNQK